MFCDTLNSGNRCILTLLCALGMLFLLLLALSSLSMMAFELSYCIVSSFGLFDYCLLEACFFSEEERRESEPGGKGR